MRWQRRRLERHANRRVRELAAYTASNRSAAASRAGMFIRPRNERLVVQTWFMA